MRVKQNTTRVAAIRVMAVATALGIGALLGQLQTISANTNHGGHYHNLHVTGSRTMVTTGGTGTELMLVERTDGGDALSIVAATGVATFGYVPVFSAGIGSTTFNPGIALGAVAVTGTITSPFTPTGGADTFLSIASSGAASSVDILLSIGDSGDSTEHVFFGDGDYTADGLITGTGGVTSTGTLTANGIVVLGDAGDTFSVASTGLDVSTGGAISNATTIAMGGALTGATTGAFSDDVTITNGSSIVVDGDGFNGNAGEIVNGVPTVRLDVVAGTAGAEDVILDNCEAGAAATWTPSGAAAPTDADDAVTFRVGSGAVAVTYGDVDVGNAIETMTTGGNWDATADEYIYLWIRSTAALSAGSLTLTLDDDTAAPDVAVNIPAVATANRWTLVRADISAVADADKNVVANLLITSNHATELDSAVVTFDQFIKVDNAESTALGFNAVNQPGGIRSGFSFVEDAGNGSFTILVEYTDFFIDHVNDRVYFMSDQSTLNDILLYASAS